MKLFELHRVPNRVRAYHRTLNYGNIVKIKSEGFRSDPARIADYGVDALYASVDPNLWSNHGPFIIEIVITDPTPQEMIDPRHIEVAFDKVTPVKYGAEIDHNQFKWKPWNHQLSANEAYEWAMAAATPSLPYWIINYFGYNQDVIDYTIALIDRHSTDQHWMWNEGGESIKQELLAMQHQWELWADRC